jgi:hypothetical protein
MQTGKGDEMSTTFAGESQSDCYFIQDSRTFCGNDVLWWCPNGNGYTTDLNEAGIYHRSGASWYRPTDIAWPVETIKPLAHLVVDMQQLPER